MSAGGLAPRLTPAKSGGITKEGKFEPFHRLAFMAQDSLSFLSVAQLALKSGIADSVSFGKCLALPLTDSLVNADIAAGDQLGLRATPTFLLNGKRYIGAVSAQVLDSLIGRTGRDWLSVFSSEPFCRDPKH